MKMNKEKKRIKKKVRMVCHPCLDGAMCLSLNRLAFEHLRR